MTASGLGPAATRSDFVVCPHCWHVNGPSARICIRCRADMLLILQESGGARWTAPAQSPVPILRGARLTLRQRAVLFGIVILFGLAQLFSAFAPRPVEPGPAPVPGAG